MRLFGSFGTLAALMLSAPVAGHAQLGIQDRIPSVQFPTTNPDKTGRGEKIPPGHLPPAGMCRIWIDDVPPGRQPAPTDCQTAVATKPANARVIWGDETPFPGKGKNGVRNEDRADARKLKKNKELKSSKGKGKSRPGKISPFPAPAMFPATGLNQ